jgi:hypothetical protein
MDDITLNLIVIGCTALIAGGIFLLVNKKQKESEQQLRQMAVQKGWQMETIRKPLVSGTRIKSTYWTIETISQSSGQESGPGSSNIAQSTTWLAPRSGSIILVGPRPPQSNLGTMGALLSQQVIQMALGPEASNVKEVQVGSSEFQKRFMVWAQDEKDADRLLTPAVQADLLTWHKMIPLIKRTSADLRIELRGFHLTKAADFQRLVQLGEKLD